VHYQLAQLYVQNKIYSEAEKEYMEVIRLDPSFILARMSLGDCYFAQGPDKFEQALKVYEDIKMRAPDVGNENFNLMLTKRMAQLYTLLKKNDQAVGELLLLKEKDNSPAINMQIGEHYFKQEDYDKAAAAYQEAWDLAPERFEPAYKLLDTYRLKEDFVKEAELLDRLVEEDKGSNRSLIYKANILFLRDYEPEAALEVLDGAVERAGNDREKSLALMLKANVLKTRFLLEEALKVLDEAIALNIPQGQQEALLQKLEIYKELNDWEKAQATAERIKKLPLTPPVKASLGDLYVKTKRYQEAVNFLRESIAGGVKSPANFVNLGTALSFMDKYEDVIAYLTPAVEEMKMENPELFRLLGGALVSQKEYQRGMELLKQYLILTGPNAWVKIQIAECQVGLANYTEAIDILQKLEAKVTLPKLKPLIDHLQARILLENEAGRDPAKALEEAQNAIEGFKTAYPEFPDGNPDLQLTLAEAYKALGDMEKAGKTAREAAEKFPYHKLLEQFVNSLEQ
jgi:tetratricopeptide (TPR) repeat protein